MKHLLPSLAAAVLGLTGMAWGQTGYSITGGLSNFDVHNQCDEPCDEFEIEIEDIRPEHVVHTYHNGNYGAPSVTLSPSGLSTIIDYRNPSHLTAVGGVEHFGVSLAQLSAANPIHVRWMRSGLTATVNGHVPTAGGGTAPATQPMLPSISADMAAGNVNAEGISFSVTNNDPAQAIWIKRRAQLTTGTVSLEALMPGDPVVTTAYAIDYSPVLLSPGQTVTLVTDLVEVEDNQSVVFAAQYYQNLSAGGPFGTQYILGPELGNVMTAAIASPESSCAFSAPAIMVQPVSTNAAENRPVAVHVDVEGNGIPVTYQWIKDGVPIANSSLYSGATTDELSIEELTPAAEGFYAVRVSSLCGTVVSDSALVFITGHNLPPPRPTACVTISGQPQSAAACGNGIGVLSVTADSTSTMSYQWQYRAPNATTGVDLVDGTFVDPDSGLTFDLFGATSPVLLMGNVQLGSHAAGVDFTVTVSAACGSATSDAATITIVPCACSVADIVGIGGTPPADGLLTGDDFNAFIGAFATGDPLADIVSIGGDPPADGLVTGDDFNAFIAAFAAGCP